MPTRGKVVQKLYGQQRIHWISLIPMGHVKDVTMSFIMMGFPTHIHLGSSYKVPISSAGVSCTPNFGKKTIMGHKHE